ncbi:hypothetical protein MTR67_015294, partial [Solanum verrucosum]
ALGILYMGATMYVVTGSLSLSKVKHPLSFFNFMKDKDHGYKYCQLCKDNYFCYATGSPVFSHLSKIKLPLRLAYVL